MARTHRASSGSETLPKYFGKHGFAYEDPNKVKKNGAGRRNWGTELDAIDDVEASGQFNFNHQRRRSNSSSLQGVRAGSLAGSVGSSVFDEED